MVSAKAFAKAGSKATRAATNSSRFSGKAATALTCFSFFFVTVDVDKKAKVRPLGTLTPRPDGVAICNRTEPSAVRHVVAVRATTKRSNTCNFSRSEYS